MADEKKSYPFVNKRNWFAIRRQFIRTIPASVTPSYIASALNLDNVDSARVNVHRGLRLAGLIDGDNKPTALALRWRDDDQYTKVCEEIRQAAYPDELKDIAPDANTPIEQVERWFRNNAGLGQSAANKYASFYLLLCESDLSKENSIAKQPASTSRSTLKTRKSSKTDSVAPSIAPDEPLSPKPPDETLHEEPGRKRARPSLHFDIQIHISPETTAEQIEQIFASMAKHLKDI